MSAILGEASLTPCGGGRSAAEGRAAAVAARAAAPEGAAPVGAESLLRLLPRLLRLSGRVRQVGCTRGISPPAEGGVGARPGVGAPR